MEWETAEHHQRLLPPSKGIDAIIATLGSAFPDSERNFIGGDFNARAHLWGDELTSDRGEKLLDFVLERRLTVLNNSDLPTFQTKNGKSFVDISLVNERVDEGLVEWSIQDHLDESDHRGIFIALKEVNEDRDRKVVHFLGIDSYSKLESMAKKVQTQ